MRRGFIVVALGKLNPPDRLLPIVDARVRTPADQREK